MMLHLKCQHNPRKLRRHYFRAVQPPSQNIQNKPKPRALKRDCCPQKLQENKHMIYFKRQKTAFSHWSLGSPSWSVVRTVVTMPNTQENGYRPPWLIHFSRPGQIRNEQWLVKPVFCIFDTESCFLKKKTAQIRCFHSLMTVCRSVTYTWAVCPAVSFEFVYLHKWISECKCYTSCAKKELAEMQ